MTKQHPSWSPYDFNGGTCVAVAGSDYCVIAADTRMSTGYNILTRHYSKINPLSITLKGWVLCCTMNVVKMLESGDEDLDHWVETEKGGSWVEVTRQVWKRKEVQKEILPVTGANKEIVTPTVPVPVMPETQPSSAKLYQHQHNKQMSCPAMAQLLSNTLYYKRFFPYYAFNVLGGLDNEGKGCVFTYDAVGSYEKVGYSSQGSGSKLIMPFLDNQLKSPSPLLLPVQDAVTPLSELEAIDLVKTAFAAATERDIYTGQSAYVQTLLSLIAVGASELCGGNDDIFDYCEKFTSCAESRVRRDGKEGDKLEIVVVNKDGLRREYMKLRED
ncbi:hypothetical protein KSS87_003486 [Heliosperma pusillum]|nr:hypothetical protein KSS87_003486 [Heliosperma pusillum]